VVTWTQAPVWGSQASVVQVSPSLQSPHASQVPPPPREKVPLGHALQAEAAPPEAVPAAQGAHMVAPALLAKLPAGQSSQLLLPGALAKCPAMQAVQDDCPAAENVPAGHDRQLVALSSA
jgi:hypothetical protein